MPVMKLTSVFVCQQCGFRSFQFLGRCPECGTWNSLVEQVEERSKVQGLGSMGKGRKVGEGAKITYLSEVEKQHFERLSTGLGEFDRVLGGPARNASRIDAGGGIVPGSLVLVSGDPGIGKSTLLTQLALGLNQRLDVRSGKIDEEVRGLKLEDQISNIQPHSPSSNLQHPTSNVLYVAGEESAHQIKIRAERINPKADLAILNETDVDVICEVIRNLRLDVRSGKIDDEVRGLKVESPSSNFQSQNPASKDRQVASSAYLQHPISLIIIDSIQTLETSDLTGVAGSVGQVRECAHRLQKVAKSLHVPIFLVGHVTKEGTVAGPKTLEHVVDVVLSLEGEPTSNFRILRSTKNRFGPTDEVGIFEMEETGMVEVKNPSKMFLETKVEAPGSAVVATLTGLRPLMVEIQALTTKSFLPAPRRVGTGIDNNRLQLLTAVLQKRLGLPLYDQDIFVNVTGGLKVFEPAADLAICLAIVSSLKDKVVVPKTMIVGEVGLLGEVREVRGLDKRIAEAKQLGFTNVISSENAKSLAQAVRLALR